MSWFGRHPAHAPAIVAALTNALAPGNQLHAIKARRQGFACGGILPSGQHVFHVPAWPLRAEARAIDLHRHANGHVPCAGVLAEFVDQDTLQVLGKFQQDVRVKFRTILTELLNEMFQAFHTGRDLTLRQTLQQGLALGNDLLASFTRFFVGRVTVHRASLA